MERFHAHQAHFDHDEQAATMLVKAFAHGGNAGRARAYAQSMRGTALAGYDPDRLIDAAEQSNVVGRLTKAAVGATEFAADDIGGPLRYLMTRVTKQSVIARLTRAVRVPFSRSTGVQILGTAAAFVGEGQGLPVVRSEFDSIVHPVRAVGSTVVATSASITDTPGSENILRDELVRAAAEAFDARFASASAATAVAPAGIAENATLIASTGGTVATIATDLAAMVDVLAASSLDAPVWLLSPKAHSFLQLLGVTSDSGERLAGFPTYSSASITGITLLASDRVALSLGDEASLGASSEGDIEMSDSPESEAATRVSLFQTNSRALRMLAFANWSIVAPSDTSGSKAVVELTGASYA